MGRRKVRAGACWAARTGKARLTLEREGESVRGRGGGDCSQTGRTRDENGVYQPPPAPTSDPTDPGHDDGCDKGGGGSEGGSDDGSAPVGTDSEADDNCPDCGEKQPTENQRAAFRRMIEKVQCSSRRSVLERNFENIKVFTEQPAHLSGTGRADLGYHHNGVIYIYEGHFKRDGSGDLSVVRSEGQLVNTLVHEAAHLYWTMEQGYFDGVTTHHAPWKSTMAECGYPNAS